MNSLKRAFTHLKTYATLPSETVAPVKSYTETRHLLERIQSLREIERDPDNSPAAIARALDPLPATLDEAALVLIDVQAKYCDPHHEARRGNKDTARAARTIAEQAPLFRALGLPIYAVYYALSRLDDVKHIGFYEYAPAPDDILVDKNQDSAFEGSTISDQLQNRGIRKLLVAGFNLNACVKKTVIDAAQTGYQVYLMRDLCANDSTPANMAYGTEGALKLMKKHKVSFTRSDLVLEKLLQQKNGPCTPPCTPETRLKSIPAPL